MIAFLPPPFSTLLAGAFLSFLGLVLLLNIFGLPANWFVLALVALWYYALPANPDMGILFWAGMIGLAVMGEVLEMGLQILKARNYGSSSSGTFAGMIGAILGAILLAPLFFGLGAFIGALLGAWLGCFVMEFLKGQPVHKATEAAFGTMMGRFLGTVCKCGIGATMIALTSHAIWPDASPLPPPLPHPPAAPPLPPGQDIVQNLILWLC